MDKMKIVELVSNSLGFTKERVLSKGQTKHLIYTRYIVVAILREEGYSNGNIKELFSKFSRNSIANHFKEVFNGLLEFNKEFKEMYLKAVKAVEDYEYESENDTSAA